MATPFSFDGTLTLPEGPNLPAEPLPFALASQYNSRVEYELDMPAAAGTISLDFGTMPAEGCKAILVTYEPLSSAAPVQITFNDASVPLELTQGGFLVFASPKPVAGITSMTVAHTTAGKLRVWILG